MIEEKLKKFKLRHGDYWISFGIVNMGISKSWRVYKADRGIMLAFFNTLEATLDYVIKETE